MAFVGIRVLFGLAVYAISVVESLQPQARVLLTLNGKIYKPHLQRLKALAIISYGVRANGSSGQ